MIRLRRDRGCECGTDLPGACPGIVNCPYSSYESPIEDDDDLDDDYEDIEDLIAHLPEEEV